MNVLVPTICVPAALYNVTATAAIADACCRDRRAVAEDPAPSPGECAAAVPQTTWATFPAVVDLCNAHPAGR